MSLWAIKTSTRRHVTWHAAARAVASAALCAALACTGGSEGPARPDESASPGAQGDGGAVDVQSGPSGTGTALACRAENASDTGASVLRRLTKLEYALTIKELLQLPGAPITDAIPDDTDRDGFRTLAALHTLSAQHLLAYSQLAEKLAAELMEDAARRERVLGCKVDAADCLRAFTARWGELAFRRPLAAGEVDALVSKARAVALDAPDSFRFVIEVLLSSPNFLFRVELGDKSEGLSTLAPHELAARLSFALWGRGPSRELLTKAANGELATPEGLSQSARSMLLDPRAKEFFSAFFAQWLHFEELRAPTMPPADWSDTLLGEMTEETVRLLDDFAFGPNARFLDVLTANYSYLSPTLAKFYRLPSAGTGFQRVTFAADSPRAHSGLLTHASLLSAKSDGDPVAIRGNWLRKTFLCQDLQLPAGLLDSLGDELVGLTRLQIIAKRNEHASCKGCHARIDPVGVGFAPFDATGRFDASVKQSDYGIAPGLPDAPAPGFASIGELGQKLRDMPEVASCLASRVFLYTQGRDPDAQDRCAVDAASRRFAAQGQGFTALVQGIVEADGFRLRRAPTP